MTRAAPAQLVLAGILTPPAPASGTRVLVVAQKHPILVALPCPGLLADERPGILERRRGDCAHLDAAELAWIDEHAGAQAMCPAGCRAYQKAPERTVEVLQASRASGAAEGARPAPHKVYQWKGSQRMCSYCHIRPAREPEPGKDRWRWCETCTTARKGARPEGEMGRCKDCGKGTEKHKVGKRVGHYRARCGGCQKAHAAINRKTPEAAE